MNRVMLSHEPATAERLHCTWALSVPVSKPTVAKYLAENAIPKIGAAYADYLAKIVIRSKLT